MDIVDRLKHMVIEDDEKTPPPPQPQSVAPVTSVGTIPTGTTAMYPPSASVSEDLLQKLRAETDFDATVAGVTLKKFLTPLESLGLDEKTKFKAAMATASSTASLTVAQVVSTFVDLQRLLGEVQRKFDQSASAFEEKEVKGRTITLHQISDQIVQKKKELEDLMSQLSTVSGELAVAQKKEQDKKDEFSRAVQVRTVEINEQRAKYEALLKG